MGWDGRLSPSVSLLRAPYGANNCQAIFSLVFECGDNSALFRYYGGKDIQSASEEGVSCWTCGGRATFSAVHQ